MCVCVKIAFRLESGSGCLGVGYGASAGVPANRSIHRSITESHVYALYSLVDQARGIRVARAVDGHAEREDGVAHVVVYLRQYGGAFGGKQIMLLFLLELQGQGENDGQQTRDAAGNHQVGEQVVKADEREVQADGHARHQKSKKQCQQNFTLGRPHEPPWLVRDADYKSAPVSAWALGRSARLDRGQLKPMEIEIKDAG